MLVTHTCNQTAIILNLLTTKVCFLMRLTSRTEASSASSARIKAEADNAALMERMDALKRTQCSGSQRGGTKKGKGTIGSGKWNWLQPMQNVMFGKSIQSVVLKDLMEWTWRPGRLNAYADHFFQKSKHKWHKWFTMLNKPDVNPLWLFEGKLPLQLYFIIIWQYNTYPDTRVIIQYIAVHCNIISKVIYCFISLCSFCLHHQ